MRAIRKRVHLARKWVAAPFADAFFGLERCLAGGLADLLRVGAGLLVGWWVYVPLHELLHAGACFAAGGEVTRLEIDGLYGGGLLAAIFPFVASGSEYAGRLTGFSTGGNDLIYLATDLGPFLMTLFPGVWLLRRAASKPSPLVFGASLPFALAPFLSVTGDAYEIGSILVTRLPRWSAAATRELVRGDDLFLLPERLAGADPSLWLAAGLAGLVGLLWCFLWWHLGAWVATALGRPSIVPLVRERGENR